ncbi:MAG: DNA mismatch repair protein MutS [Spirochaetaceae bacterium]|jgi:DNA mismatch repair protein MutS|nr:DNA mismatch repair protein MutS [Spirochaetaceae bacterium]
MAKSSNADSPLLTQYRRLKRQQAGNVLFFRLGDFYEMFAEDAIEVSSLLNLTLTSRNGLPMCGVPYHSARNYIARLLKNGKKVAICEQLSAPRKGNAIIERDIVEVITPGTTVDEDFLEKGDSNYLAALCGPGGPPPPRFAFAYIDLSTGEFEALSFDAQNATLSLRSLLERLQIKELIVQESLLNSGETGFVLEECAGLVINRWMDWLFDGEKSFELLTRQFGTETLKGFGFERDAVEILAAGALLEYIDGTAKSLLPHIRKITLREDSEFVGIDEASLRNLELLHGIHGGEGCSLFEIIDETKTAMGKRLLRQRLTSPLRDVKKINARAAFVEALYCEQALLSDLRELLGRTGDIERQVSRLAMRKSHGKDMFALKNALSRFSAIETVIEGCSWKKPPAEGACSTEIPIQYESLEARSVDSGTRERLAELSALLEQALCDEPSVLFTEGKLIRRGYNAELDRLHLLCDGGRQTLEAYLDEEREATGISSLKIKYNRIIGYFFEVTKANIAKIPAHFIRRQKIDGRERFTTDRLAGLESEINGASSKIIELERELFFELRERAAALVPEIAAAARRIAELDVAQSLATAATRRGWIRPAVDEQNRLVIIEGRHPVVESRLARGEFIPNDTLLDAREESSNQGSPESSSKNLSENSLENLSEGAAAQPAFALITGPNMAGKSTYLRQSALIVIMAQIGSFVPAHCAKVGIVDRIYCRVGASDNLARGESTFLVEMNETAFILNTATERSLVIMDEVGRGTGTLDGISIAQAVGEALLNRIRCRTLFATHYHELAEMRHKRLAQRSMLVEEKAGKIIFRRRLVEGAAAESYGLHVARLAGLDEAVCRRAEKIMEELRGKTAAQLKLPPEPQLKNTPYVKNTPYNEAAAVPVNKNLKAVKALEGDLTPSLFG